MNKYRWYYDLWWMVRGVKTRHHNVVCDRCGHKGKSHFRWLGCWRFKPKKITVILHNLG